MPRTRKEGRKGGKREELASELWSRGRWWLFATARYTLNTAQSLDSINMLVKETEPLPAG